MTRSIPTGCPRRCARCTAMSLTRRAARAAQAIAGVAAAIAALAAEPQFHEEPASLALTLSGLAPESE